MAIYYRVIEDDFSEEKGQDWIVDCLIQTEDLDDFDDFEEALSECMERIQERIDAQEDAGDDQGYLEKLREKLSDTSEAVGSDWEIYESCISQPTVSDRRTVEREPRFLTLTKVEDRKTARSLIDEGMHFGPNHDFVVSQVEKYERLSAIGAGGPKVKAKLFKERPRPPMTLGTVNVSPALLQSLPTKLIRGLLTRHRQSWESQESPYSPLDQAYKSRMSGPDESTHYFVLTIFLDFGDVTFATALPKRFPDPDNDQITERCRKN